MRRTLSPTMEKVKSVLDVTIVKLICQLEESVYLYIDKSMPKKFRPTLVQQLVTGLGQARKFTVKSMDLSPLFKDWLKVSVKPKYTTLEYYKRKNKKRKREMLLACSIRMFNF